MSEAIYDELAAEAPPVPETPDSETPEAEAADTTESTGGSGRPRPQETIDRDAKVFEFMNGADTRFTKAELVEGTGLPSNEVYLSLYRLGKGLVKKGEAPKVERVGRNWGVVGKEYPEPVAEETPAEATAE